MQEGSRGDGARPGMLGSVLATASHTIHITHTRAHIRTHTNLVHVHFNDVCPIAVTALALSELSGQCEWRRHRGGGEGHVALESERRQPCTTSSGPVGQHWLLPHHGRLNLPQ